MAEFSPSQRVRSLPDNYFANIDKRIDEFNKKGIDLIHLETGSPDQPTPYPIVRALDQASRLPGNQGYPPYGGKTNLKEAIAAFYQREYGVALDPETEVTVFAGAQVAIASLPQVLLDPGDVMITTDPAYPMYFSCAKLAKAKVYGIPVQEQDGFLPDYHTVPEDVVKQTKLLMLNYPNNPTGAVATEKFFSDTLDFAKEHRIPVVHDFAYAAFGFDGVRPLSFLQTPGAKDYGIEIYTMSKTYNMAGWRLGFAVGNRSIIRSLSRFHDIAHSDVFGAVQDAAAAALLGPQDCVRDLRALYERRRNVFISNLQAIGWNVLAPAGSFFNWLKVPKGYTSETFADTLLEQAHVAMAPGIGFGPHGDQYVRASLLEPEDRLQEAARRIIISGVLHPLASDSLND
ncbi:aminotransferase class I/II-fold pyridoxal phosphate-dependent enzyme [Sporolactobacillus sp. THM7-4]|nr:aminotransferase class I/II-fold pyridoxal phosphate-dependent enzyme [Sporolactobacillus sp. THM7-4]